MKLKSALTLHSAVLFVQDIAVTKKFYTEILYLTLDMDFGMSITFKNGLSLWQIQSGHPVLENLDIHSPQAVSSNRFEIYFETESMDHIVNQLNNAQVEFLHPLHEETWGQRTIRFFDPDRHLVEIGESSQAFVRRMHEQGMTPPQIAEKTSIPLDYVRELLKK